MRATASGTMIDWDDIRYFLAVARRGSVRAAAQHLRVNHSTILRRIAQLENHLAAQIFEKLPSGYRLTAAGEDILQFAEEMEASSNHLAERVFGRDQGVRGPLRVTMPPVLASHLLMPDLVDFARLHPEVEMEILSIDDPVSLVNREADVAIRNVYDRETLAPNLHGRKGPDVHWCVYCSRDLDQRWRAGQRAPIRWIIKKRYGHPDWCRENDFVASEVLFKTTDAGAQIGAVRLGLGMTLLPCFVGDCDPMLARVPGAAVHMHGSLWMLTHGETRRTKRVRLFTEFISRRLAAHVPVIAGLSRPSE